MMEKSVVCIGANHRFGKAVCRNLLAKGWTVFADIIENSEEELDSLVTVYPTRYHAIPMNPQSIDSIRSAADTISGFTKRIDMLISTVDEMGNDCPGDGMDFDCILRTYDINGLGSLRFIEAFLPLMEQSMKRLCFVSSAQGCITLSDPTDNIGYSMSKTALHMAVKIMFNDLRGEGFSFRLLALDDAKDSLVGCNSINVKEELAGSVEWACEYFLSLQENEDRLRIINTSGEELPF